jgi:hypothetical protein
MKQKNGMIQLTAFAWVENSALQKVLQDIVYPI